MMTVVSDNRFKAPEKAPIPQKVTLTIKEAAGILQYRHK